MIGDVKLAPWSIIIVDIGMRPIYNAHLSSRIE